MAETRLPIGEFSQNRLEGWESKSFKDETRYSLQSMDGVVALQADSRASGSGLFKQQRIDLEKTRFLTGLGESSTALSSDQYQLEQAYKQYLQAHYGIVFNQLFAIANMPIQRFGSMLVSQGRFEDYLALLRSSFNAENLDDRMCRNTISVDWQGYVYDCDFNQMLSMPLAATAKPRPHIAELTLDGLNGAVIATATHCYGCAAGQGSSCGGALDGNR